MSNSDNVHGVKRAISLLEMHNLKIFSSEWFEAAFQECDAPVWAKHVASKICASYRICGQADPAYIANAISESERLHGR